MRRLVMSNRPDVEVMVADEDYAWAAAFGWGWYKASKNHFYAGRRFKGETCAECGRSERRQQYLHRAVYARMIGEGVPAGMVVDHVNGDTKDCRRVNLRCVTPRQNSYNTRAVNGYKGVREVKDGVYTVEISKDGLKYTVGTRWESLELAARAYDLKAEELFGEYARLNFPARAGAEDDVVPF